MKRLKCSAVIVAAGNGTRMKSKVSKQFIKINDTEIFAIAVEKFEKMSQITQIIIVTSAEYFQQTLVIKTNHNWQKVKVVVGGKERQNSVYNGLNALDKDTDIVLIHDGVRPFVTEKNILDVIEKTLETGACILAVPVKDTIKICEGNIVKETPKRSSLWAIQTPQGFNYSEILKAYEKFGALGSITDDAMLMEQAGFTVTITEGSYENIKITTPEDLVFGKALLESEDKKNRENS